MPPLILADNTTKKFHRRLLNRCIDALDDICKYLNIDKWYSKVWILNSGLNQWEKLLLEKNGNVLKTHFDLFVNLSLSEEDILERMYKNNRYNIQRGKRIWRTEIITRCSEEDIIEASFNSFINMHIEVSGRITRTIQSWDIQKKALKEQDDFIVMLYDSKDNLVGASLFQVSHTVGLYSSAVYNRELFNEPVAHVSLWSAITHMKKHGLKWFYIGEQFYAGNTPEATPKELNISRFKQGFASNIFPRLILEKTVSKIM